MSDWLQVMDMEVDEEEDLVCKVFDKLHIVIL